MQYMSEVKRMAYQDAVAQAAAALNRGEDANWELARLTWENTISIPGAHVQEGRVSMRQWCADVEERAKRSFAYSTAFRFKAIWVNYALSLGSGEPFPPFWDCWGDLRGEDPDDRTTATQRFLPTNARNIIEQGTPEVKRELAVKLMADPEVADAVISQAEPRRAVYDALNRREQSAELRRERITDADPVSRELRSLNALVDLDQTIEQFVKAARENLRLIAQSTDIDIFANRAFLTMQLEQLKEVTQQIETLITTGKTDLDAFLDSVLKG